MQKYLIKQSVVILLLKLAGCSKLPISMISLIYVLYAILVEGLDIYLAIYFVKYPHMKETRLRVRVAHKGIIVSPQTKGK